MSATVRYDGLSFERLGHASVRIATPDSVVYVDPWSDVLEGAPGDGDVVFVTHDDFDHWDPDAIDAVAAPDATVVAYEGVDAGALDHDVVTIGQDEGTTVEGIGVRTTPAYNEPDGPHVDDSGNPFHDRGEVVGFLLDFDGTSVFVVSDTDFLDAHRELSADVVIPPIGGHYTMDRHEAADLVRAVDPDLVLPAHYDTFEPVETDAGAFAEELGAAGYRVELF